MRHVGGRPRILVFVTDHVRPNAEIADMFEQLADLPEIREENPFRIRAYRNAAQFIRGHGRSMSDMVAAG